MGFPMAVMASAHRMNGVRRTFSCIFCHMNALMFSAVCCDEGIVSRLVSAARREHRQLAIYENFGVTIYAPTINMPNKLL